MIGPTPTPANLQNIIKMYTHNSNTPLLNKNVS